MKLFKIIGCVFVFVSLGVSAPELMEAVAAVVDGKPIMRSELLENFYRYQSMPESAGKSEAELKKEVLDKLIDDKVLLSRIDRDSIKISESEVDQRVTTHLTNLAASQHIDLGTLERAIRAQLGLSMAQYRDQLAKQIREHLYITRIRQLHVGALNPTNKEVIEFFNTYKDSLPRQYNCILVSHIQLDISPNKKTIDSVKAIAEALIDSLDHGMNWEVLTKRHSQDSTADKGGDLGYIRKGLLDPEYERATARLNNGQHSETPVKTSLGWHIIKVIGRREDGVRTAHILLRTIPTAADSAKVLAQADSLSKVANTKELFAASAKKFSQDKSSNHSGGRVGWFQRNELDSAYIAPVSRLQAGENSEPILIENAYHVFRLDDERQVRELSLEDDYEKIRSFAANRKETEKLNELVKKWREEVLIEIRMTE